MFFRLLNSSSFTTELHPLVSQAAKKPLLLGHYQLAILAANISLIEAVQRKNKVVLVPVSLKKETSKPQKNGLTKDSANQRPRLALLTSLVQASEIPLALAINNELSQSQVIECLIFTSVLFQVLDSTFNPRWGQPAPILGSL